jgi:hypothetical protein
MIYIIGGPPRGGKTILASTLAARLGIPYFTIDHVASVIAPYIPEREHADKLPLRVARQATDYSNDSFYATYSTPAIVDLYVRQAITYWPGVREFISYALADEHELILEGWQLLPHLVSDVITFKERHRARVVFLYKLDVPAIVTGLKAGTRHDDWVIKNTKREETFASIATMLAHFGNQVRADAGAASFEAINMDHEFTATLDAVLTEWTG